MKVVAHNFRRGLALTIVLTVIAIATLIGLVMLSSSTLQAQVAHGAAQAAAADYLAESAVQTAAYYLQKDLAGVPASWTGTPGYAIRALNVSVSGVDGSFDISATATGITDRYLITAVGRSSGSTPVTRTATSQIRVMRTTPSYAVGSGGAVTVFANNHVNGGSFASSGAITNFGALNGGSRTFQTNEFLVPSTGTGNISYYGGGGGGTYTTPAGSVGTIQTLSSGTITSTASLTANANNPGKVFYYNGDVYIMAAGTYNGTIIARGRFELKPPMNSAVTINRQAGFPAVVADGTLIANARNLNANINGVVWAGRGTSWGAGVAVTGSCVRINGALLMPGSQAMGVGGLGSLVVNYTPANVDLFNLTTAVQPSTGVKYLTWQQ